MKLKKDVDLKKFVENVKKCANDVYFETKEGDHLNLKSTLSEYIFVASRVDNDFLRRGVVLCENVNDFVHLSEFLETV
ncbi:MAG: hypothetical protein ACERKZ_06485 [Lachnotalea sp.]